MRPQLSYGVAALAALALALPAAASRQVLEPCETPAGSAADLIARLEEGGLTALPPSRPIPAEIVERLLWITTIPYLGGDGGGEPLPAIVDVQARAAANYGRLVPLPTSETRILTGEGITMVARWQEPEPGTIEVHCGAATYLGDEADLLPTNDRYGDLAWESGEEDGIRREHSTFQFDREAVIAELPDALPPHYVTTLQLRYDREDIK